MKLLLITCVLGVGLLGCHGGALQTPAVPNLRSPGNLSFRDDTGTICATAYIQLPQKLPAIGKSTVGKWKLLTWTASFPSKATTSGDYSLDVYEDECWIDLNPNTMDNNVILVGPTNSLPMSGSWFRATYAYGVGGGSYDIRQSLRPEAAQIHN